MNAKRLLALLFTALVIWGLVQLNDALQSIGRAHADLTAAAQ